MRERPNRVSARQCHGIVRSKLLLLSLGHAVQMRLLPVWCVLALIIMIGPVSADPDVSATPKPKIGLSLGEQVPISSMHVLRADGQKEFNTCLAGQNRDKKTLSLYSRDLEDEFWQTVAEMERWLKDHDDWRGYVLIITERTDKAAEAVRAGMKKLELKHVQIAFSNTPPLEFVSKYKLAQHDSIHLLVYSDKLQVKFRESFCSGKVDAAFLKELGERVVKAAK